MGVKAVFPSVSLPLPPQASFDETSTSLASSKPSAFPKIETRGVPRDTYHERRQSYKPGAWTEILTRGVARDINQERNQRYIIHGLSQKYRPRPGA